MFTDAIRKPLDLPALVAAAMSTRSTYSRVEIEAVVIADTEKQIGHALSEWHVGQIGLEVALQFNARECSCRPSDADYSVGGIYRGDCPLHGPDCAEEGTGDLNFGDEE
jgi:hypothetical protein